MIIVSYIYLCSIMKMKYKNDKMRFFNKYVVVAGFVSTGSIPVCIVPQTKKNVCYRTRLSVGITMVVLVLFRFSSFGITSVTLVELVGTDEFVVVFVAL